MSSVPPQDRNDPDQNNNKQDTAGDVNDELVKRFVEGDVLDDQDAEELYQNYRSAENADDVDVSRMQMEQALQLVQDTGHVSYSEEQEVSVRVTKTAKLETSRPQKRVPDSGRNVDAPNGRTIATHLAALTLGIVIGAAVWWLYKSTASPSTGQSTPSGVIDSHSDHQLVESQFQVSGKASGIPHDHAVFLVVEFGDLSWPKSELIIGSDGRWHTTVDAEKQDFRIALYSADPSATDEIRKWFQSTEFVGRVGFRGVTLLDWVPLRVSTP